MGIGLSPSFAARRVLGAGVGLSFSGRVLGAGVGVSFCRRVLGAGVGLSFSGRVLGAGVGVSFCRRVLGAGVGLSPPGAAGGNDFNAVFRASLSMIPCLYKFISSIAVDIFII